MPEAVINLHMHTPYSDGSGTHAEIGTIAAACGLDAVIVTDHNILVRGMEGYYGEGKRKTLLLVGQEVHDRMRVPQKNHTLIFGAERELAAHGHNPQGLMDAVHQAGGMAFLAHPIDPALPAFGEDDISWVDWSVRGYTGIELWNGFSELKSRIKGKLSAVLYAYFPRLYPLGPLPETLALWDRLNSARGARVAALGGSDAHALRMLLGPFSRVLYPYAYHFSTVNTHLQLDEDLSFENLAADRQQIYSALRAGHAFIGYDLPAPTRGFRFTAQHSGGTATMGDEIRIGEGVTIQVTLPQTAYAHCRLLRDGVVVRDWNQKRFHYTHVTSQPGVYRVECTIRYLGKQRGWIYSNPIYIRA